MAHDRFQLQQAPIIEAVLDIDCDLTPSLDWAKLQVAGHEVFRDRYPKIRQQFVQHHVLTAGGEAAPLLQFNQGLGAIQYLTDDEKQLIQFRPNGFSFNRLAPYSTLDDYFPEIEAAWNTFQELARPVQIRKIGLRMINRILLPMREGGLDFAEFLTTAPRLPNTGLKLGIIGFLNQQVAADAETGNQVNIVQTSQLPEGDRLPVILDIDAYFQCQTAPPGWAELLDRIQSLRDLKNSVFRHTLTPQCLNLFSHSA